MKKPDAAARAAAMAERMQKAMREMTENPEMAKGSIGTVVLALIRLGEEVSTESIIAELEAVASGAATKTDLTAALAKGALKVISDLQNEQAG